MGSTVGPSSTTSPGTRASLARAAATASMTGPSNAFPSRSRRARAASMLARIAPGRARRRRRLDAGVEPGPADPPGAGEHDGSLRERGKRLVRTRDDGIRPGRDRVRRQRRVEAEVRSPRRVDDERDAVPVRDRRQARHVTDRADVGRVADEHRSGVRGACQRRLEGAGGHPDGQAVAGVDLGPHPHRHEPARARGRAASTGAGSGPRRRGRPGGRRRARAPGCRGSSRRRRTGRGRRPRGGRPGPRPRRARRGRASSCRDLRRAGRHPRRRRRRGRAAACARGS